MAITERQLRAVGLPTAIITMLLAVQRAADSDTGVAATVKKHMLSAEESATFSSQIRSAVLEAKVQVDQAAEKAASAAATAGSAAASTVADAVRAAVKADADRAAAAAAAVPALAADLANGRVYATGAGSITSAAAPTGALRVMTSAGGETQIWGRTDAPDPAVETDTLKRDASGQWWRRHFDTRSIGYLSTGIRETGLIRTTIDAASTGDAIVLSIADGTAAAGISSISTSTWIEYVPSVSNAAANPTITIAGATYGVRDADGGNWPAGGFKAGRSYNLRRRNTTLRVVAGGVDQAELAALTADFSRGRVFAMGAGSPTGGAIPDGTRRILTSAGGETQVWASTTAPDPAVETDTLKQDAAGQWWRRHFDTRDLGALTNEVRTGRTFYLGGALTMSGATVPDNISLVVAGHHASNTVRFWRAIGVPADNTEIPDVRVKDAAGRWWQAMEDAIAKDAVAKLDEGRVFTVYAPTPKDKIVPLKVDGVLALAAGEASLWAPQAAPDPAVETDILCCDPRRSSS